MSTTERRAVEVGQVRLYGGKRITISAIADRIAFTCRSGEKDADGYEHNGGCCWDSVSVLEDCELVIPAPQPKPACGAPEGYQPCLGNCGRWAFVPGNHPGPRIHCNACVSGPAGYEKDHPDWTPPLESKPAETGKPCVEELEAMGFKAPAAQEAPKAEQSEQLACIKANCKTPDAEVRKRIIERGSGWVGLCDPCYLRGESQFATLTSLDSSGTPYAGPERLERPKLAHSMGVEDPALEDA